MSIATKAYLNAFIGIVIFSATLPVTKLALGTDNTQLTPEFITFGRSAIAGLFSIIFLFINKKNQIKFSLLFFNRTYFINS